MPDPDQELVAEVVEAGRVVVRPGDAGVRRAIGPPASESETAFQAAAMATAGFVGVSGGQAASQAAGRDRLESAVERLAEQRLQPLEDGRAGAAGVKRVGSAVPEDRVMVEAAEPAVGGLGLGAELGGLLGLLLAGPWSRRRWGLAGRRASISIWV